MVNQFRITLNGDAFVFKSDESDCFSKILAVCHSCASRNPINSVRHTTNDWIPVCTGKTRNEIRL